MINSFINSCSSLENHIRFQTKMGKIYTRFQTKTAQKTLPFGVAHTYMAHTRDYPPPPTNIRHTLIVKRKSKRKGPYQCDRNVYHYVWMWSTLINMCALKFHSICYVEFSEFQSPILVYLVKCPFTGSHLRQTTLRQKHNGIRKWLCRFVCTVNMLT